MSQPPPAQSAVDPRAPQVSVVLPTYREAESLPALVPRIAEALTGAGLAYEIVVVDDDSPDGTADVARALSERFPMRVEQRKGERGLATAVLRGFAFARAPICVVMDADGSHPPSVLPQMVRLIADDKADIVVGSRHVAGGGSQGWPLSAQLKSSLAAALTFGLSTLTDPTSGLMAIKRSLLSRLTLDPVGWKIVLETVVKAAPARVVEVPIVFEERALGESKQSLRVYLEYLAHVARLYGHRYPTLRELCLFCLVGLSGLVVDLATVVAVKELLALDTRLCAVAGFLVAVSTNYVQNRRFTFGAGRELPVLYSYLTYLGANLLGLGVRILIVHGLIVATRLDSGYGYLATNAIGIVAATLFNFLGAKYLAFDPARFAAQRVEPLSAAPEPELPRGARGALLSIVVASGLVTAVACMPWREITSANEGVNVTMAENVRADAGKLLRPSVYPGGRRDWRAEDLPALGNTPLYSALLAAFGSVGALPAMGALPWLSLWAIVACSALLLAPTSRRAALYCALLLGTSPAFLALGSSLEMEPTLTAFCAGALLCLVRGVRARRPRTAALGGALLGLGFLTKIWLVLPYALAACAFVLVQTTLGRSASEPPLRLRRPVIAFALGFLASASLHPLGVLLLAPEDFSALIGHVYLGLFSGQGVTAAKLGGADPQLAQPAWYYPALLYRDSFHLLPLALLGLPALLRRGRTDALALLGMAFGSALGVIALSVPAAKEPLYALPLVPLPYALCALCLAEVEADDRKFRIANRGAAYAAIAVAVLATLAVWVFAAESRAGALPFPPLHTLGTLAVIAAALEVVRRSRAFLALCAGSALALGAYAASRAETPRPSAERALATAIAPALERADPAYPSFVAPESRVLMGMLGRAGRDLGELPGCALPSDPRIAVVVLGPPQRAAGCEVALTARFPRARPIPLPEAARAYAAFALP